MGGKIGVAADAVCATGPHVYQTVGSPITDAPEEKKRCRGRSIDMGIPTTLDAYFISRIYQTLPLKIIKLSLCFLANLRLFLNR